MIFKTNTEKINFLNKLEFGVRSKYIFISLKNGGGEMYCVKFLWTAENVFLPEGSVDIWYDNVKRSHKNGFTLVSYLYKNQRGHWAQMCGLAYLPEGFDLENIFHNNYIWADDPIELYKSLDSYEKDVTCKTQILMELSE